MTELTYINCPFCSHSVVHKQFKTVKFPISPTEFYILTRRRQKSLKGFPRGKGKGMRGFFNIPGEEKTIVQLTHGTDEEKKIATKIINRIREICKAYKKAGLL